MRKLYPGGRKKAFNITYDDGVLQDVRFVALLNKYGLKGTFNLNSQLMGSGFSWTHPSGVAVTRLTREEIGNLYDGHEIASHTLTHTYLQTLDHDGLMEQLGRDRKNLEMLFGREVKGFAVPFDYYSQEIADYAKLCGFEYARKSEFSLSYKPGTDWYHWKTGVYHIHPELKPFVKGFLLTDRELALCQIVGHSYDLDTENLWDTMEEICAQIAGQEDVWPCTNLELVRYLKAMEAFDGINRSELDLWFEIDGEIVKIKANEGI